MHNIIGHLLPNYILENFTSFHYGRKICCSRLLPSACLTCKSYFGRFVFSLCLVIESFEKFSVTYYYYFHEYFLVNCDYIFYAETCRQFVKVHPFCFKAMCDTNCYLEAKFEGVYVGEYHCDGHGIYGLCICRLCKH